MELSRTVLALIKKNRDGKRYTTTESHILMSETIARLMDGGMDADQATELVFALRSDQWEIGYDAGLSAR